MKLFLLTSLLLTQFAWGQNMDNLSLKEKIKHFYNNSSKDNMTLVDQFYDQNIYFKDPLTDLRGVDKMRNYYTHLYQNVKSIRFDFPSMHQEAGTVVAVWIMTLETEKLNGGKPIIVEGTSVIKFNAQGKAIEHADYFDMGVFLYERIPVLGSIIRAIKTQLKTH
jgi:hypothetical protein